MKENFSVPNSRKDVFRTDKVGEPIARDLKNLESGNEEISSKDIPRDIETVKREAYAIAAFLIKRVHSRVKKNIRENPVLLRESLREIEGFPNNVNVFSIDSTGDLFVDDSALGEISPESFARWCTNLSFPKIYDAFFDDAFSEEKKEFSEREKAAYDRLSSLLYKGDLRTYTRKGKVVAYSPETFIGRGVGTGTFESWSLLLTTVVSYQKRFDREMTPEILNNIMPVLKEILVKFSSLHVKDYSRFTAIRNTTGDDLSSLHQLWSRVLEFGGTAENPYPFFNEDFLEECRILFEHAEEYREWQQGCPARDVRIETSDGKKVNIISDVFDFYKELAEKIVLPNQDLLQEGLQEIEKQRGA